MWDPQNIVEYKETLLKSYDALSHISILIKYGWLIPKNSFKKTPSDDLRHLAVPFERKKGNPNI